MFEVESSLQTDKKAVRCIKTLKEHHFDPTLHHRRSLRLPGYNYAAEGAYFVTICLDEPQPLLLNPDLRAIVEETWNALSQRFPTIALDECIIMPDHIHFIVWLHPNKESRPTLGRVVGALKSLTGRVALNYLRSKGLRCGQHFWQRDFHDHVIRNEADLKAIAQAGTIKPLRAEKQIPQEYLSCL